MGSAIRKIGNSAGVILPKPVLETLGAKLGDTLEFVTEGAVVRIETTKRNPREGWAEAAKLIAADGFNEDDVAWLEAPLNIEAEDDWTW